MQSDLKPVAAAFLILLVFVSFLPFSAHTQPQPTLFQLLKTFEGIAPGDNLALAAAFPGDVDRDGFPDVLLGAPGASPAGRNLAGSAFLYSGQTYSLIHQFDGQNAGDDFGIALAGAGDLNRDGFIDIVIGADNADPGNRTDAGSVYAYSGSDYSLLNRLDGGAASDFFGASMASMGDTTGDGLTEFAVGAIGSDPSSGRQNAGSVYVYSGNMTLLKRLDGQASQDSFGVSVAGVDDVNDDGYSDLLVGADLADPGGRINAGSAYLYSGLDYVLLNRFDGASAGDFLGTSVSKALDVDRDGRPDILIGAPAADPGGRTDSGSVYLFSGESYALLHRWDGESAFDEFGWSVSEAGNASPDTVPDILVGADLVDTGSGVDAGRVYLFSGSDYSLLGQMDGGAQWDNYGWALDGNSDTDGNGKPNLIVGGPISSPGGRSEAGSGYLYNLVFSPNNPPAATFTHSPAAPQVDEPISLDASASSDPDPGGTIVFFSWDLGDGSTRTGMTISHSYTSPGLYHVILNVTDNTGASSTFARDILVVARLIVSITSNSTGGIGEFSVGFSAQTSGGQQPYSYTWDFGDGQTSTQPSPTHMYTVPGSHQARLTVTDSVGHTATDTILITAILQPAGRVGILPADYLLYGLITSIALLALMTILLMSVRFRGRRKTGPSSSG